MADAAVMDSPAAAPAAAPEAPTSPSPSSGRESFSPATPELKPTAPAVDKGPQPDKPKPGSAKEKMFQELRTKYGGEKAEPEKKPEPKEGDEPETEASEKAEDQPAPAPGEKPAPGDKKKVSPWKLVDEHKAARAKVESELNEIKKTIGDPAKLKQQVEAIQSIQKRNQELEQEIKYVNYSKSKEFQEKYQQPYEDAWKKWMGELGELVVTDTATGSDRPIQPQDLLELVNMPLQKARAAASDIYGAFADDVMGARKELRGLFDSQQKALDDAKKNSDGYQARMQQEFSQKREALGKEITETWSKANECVVKDEKISKFFKPVEGDDEGNQRLTKGYELADKAFSVNPFDPRLTPEQRAEIVQLHAAVRNRAAAFGRLSLQNSRLEQKLASLTKELNKYKEAEPPAAGGQETQHTQGHSSARDEVMAGLRKYLH